MPMTMTQSLAAAALYEALNLLDLDLTDGNVFGSRMSRDAKLDSIRNQHRFNEQTLEDWVLGGVEWYLSDGGYSRVVMGRESRKIFLTSNSIESTRARWSGAATQRQNVERLAQDLRFELWGDEPL